MQCAYVLHIKDTRLPSRKDFKIITNLPFSYGDTFMQLKYEEGGFGSMTKSPASVCYDSLSNNFTINCHGLV